ncbi:MAG: DUF1631 domain-containing protein [Pseudomonadota bacterium]|nr:DUF1631 domain-containing protein [Pseudomonadota bacterium]
MVQGNNVVPLGGIFRARLKLSPQESASELKGCRELALERMAGALSGMLDRVEDELFDLAEKSVDRDAQNVFLDARSQARANRDVIESTFRQHFVELFNRKVRGDSAAAPQPAEGAELSLLAHEDLEGSLAVSAMSNQLKTACEGELFALSQRMGFLLERPELEDDANPVSPAMICAALKDACDEIQSDYKVRMTLLRQLVGQTESELQRVYHDLNAHLVARRILPEVRASVRRAAPAAKRPSAAAPLKTPAESATDLYSTLAQLLGAASSAAAVRGGGVSGGPVNEGGAVSGGAPSGGESAVSGAEGMAAPQAAFVAELTRMHRGAAATPGDTALVNILKDLKRAPQGALLATVDAMTIDIVAMLFDFVFEDEHIPASVKALLGRLQIPTLKVALLDKGFFSSKAHPARRLIDQLAEISFGLDDGDARGGATLALVESVVDAILHEFDTDLALFEAMTERVQAFIEEQARADADIVERSSRVVEAREREEIARRAGEEEVSRRLMVRVWVPAPVRAMLLETWTTAFAAVQLSEGEGSPAWQELVHTMDDLLWSVEPKTTPEERKRLVVMLPGMLKQIHHGLARGAMGEAERDAFLGELVDCHALAVKAGLRGLAAVPELPAPAPLEEPKLEREILPAGDDSHVEEIRLRGPRGAAVRNVFTRTGIYTNLRRGTWVEFARAASAPTRARLTWVSPNKGVYLFTNPATGANAVSISPEALAEQMRLGEARVIDDAPLVDRAVDSMIENLRKVHGAR